MVNQGDREVLPSCCEEHRIQFALYLSHSRAAEYNSFLIAQEPESGWYNEAESALAFVASLNHKEQK
jgi:hypothetical protein